MILFKFVNEKRSFPVGDKETLPELLSFVEDSLTKLGVKRQLIIRTMLLAEEVAAAFMENADPDDDIRVQVKRYIGDACVTLRLAGKEVDLISSRVASVGVDEEAEDKEVQRAIRSLLLKSQEDKFKYKYKNGINQARLATGQFGVSLIYRTISALLLGVLLGLLMMFVLPEGFSTGLSNYLLEPLQTVFMNALRIIVGPVIFFSIVSSFSKFTDLSELGRIGAKVMGIYMATTLCAVLLGIGTFIVLQPGTAGFALSGVNAAGMLQADSNVDVSLLSTIINIVPSNLVRPFLEADTLQIIFLAVICGIAVGMIGEYSSVLTEWFEACNALFLTITSIVSRFIPLVVFASTALMLRNLGGGTFIKVVGMGVTAILAMLLMICVYALMLLTFGQLNPFTFFKKNFEGMITSFTLSSSSAAMPTNMRTCTDKLGVSPKVCSFSIPLGATVNMDGASINFAIMSLFLAKAYGVSVSPSALVSLAVLVMLVSVGVPGVPGAGYVCLGIFLQRLGVPIEAMGLVMGIYPILDMFTTMSNTTGDVAATTIVAKSEGLLDLERFNQ